MEWNKTKHNSSNVSIIICVNFSTSHFNVYNKNQTHAKQINGYSSTGYRKNQIMITLFLIVKFDMATN